MEGKGWRKSNDKIRKKKSQEKMMGRVGKKWLTWHNERLAKLISYLPLLHCIDRWVEIKLHTCIGVPFISVTSLNNFRLNECLKNLLLDYSLLSHMLTIYRDDQRSITISFWTFKFFCIQKFCT